MLAKIFALILGLLGVVTTTVHSPVQNIPTISEITTTSVAEKTKTDNKTPDFTLVKSATTTPKSKIPTAKVTAKPTATTSPIATINLLPKVPVVVNFDPINQLTRASLVNILCTSQIGGSFEPLSGSGVIIDPRGIILTNAHIGQYLLLKDYRIKNFLKCVARTGSPASPKYTLKLLYISRQWVKDNYQQITSGNPTGTGENDFALLQITGRTDPDLALESNFPSIPVEQNENFLTGDSALIAGYPAGFLGGIAIQRDLYIVSSIITIGEIFTFRTGTMDVFSLGGSPVAQRGSSGGAVVNSEGKLIGIVVTSTSADSTDKRDLDAISTGHISRSLASETDLTLSSLPNLNLEQFSTDFDEVVLPELKKLLVDQLDAPDK